MFDFGIVRHWKLHYTNGDHVEFADGRILRRVYWKGTVYDHWYGIVGDRS